MKNLSKKRAEEIERKAASFVKRRFIDYRGYHHYLNELLDETNLRVVNLETGEIDKQFLSVPEVKVASKAFFKKKDEIETDEFALEVARKREEERLRKKQEVDEKRKLEEKKRKEKFGGSD